ncbi:amidohydrolase [Myxococcota bacterium]|nr:amidohydrolase [Myxococcota bacterium]
MDRYLMISSDGHAGLPPERYREYVDPRYRDAFDVALPQQLEQTRIAEKKFFVKEFNEKWRRGIESELQGAWDSDRRLAVIDADGVAAEVLFPDGITEMNAPPFGAGLGLKPWNVDPELQWAGARAHNRWLTEFCAEAPERRIGVAVIPAVYDVDDAVEETRRAHEAGLRGILIPALWGEYPAYHHPRYDPLWAACQDLKMVVHTHSGPTPDFEDLPGMMGIYLTEFVFWAVRPLWVLIFGGVFERFPRLKFAVTEVSEFHLPAILEMMEIRASEKHTSGKLGNFRGHLSMEPSEYFARNCWVGASLLDPLGVSRRHQIGVKNLMWGTDYPHPEGLWPRTHERIGESFKGVPPNEMEAIFGLNAVECYGLELDALTPIAQRIGPPRQTFSS